MSMRSRPPSLSAAVVAAAVSLTASAALAAGGGSLPATAPAAATSQPSGPADLFILDARKTLEKAREAAPLAKPHRIDEVVKFAIAEDGTLGFTVADPSLGDEAAVPVGPDAVVSLNYIGSADSKSGARVAHLTYDALDASDPKHPRALNVDMLCGLGSTQVSVNDLALGSTTTGDIMDRPQRVGEPDAAPEATFRFSRTADTEYGGTTQPSDDPTPAEGPEGKRELKASNFVGLIDAHHDAIVSACGEGFAALRAMHVLSGLTEPQARQLLVAGGGEDDGALGRSVDEIVESLRKDGSAAVDASVAKLGRLGNRAIDRLGKLDRKGWSPDLKMSVDTVLAQTSSLPVAKGQELLATPGRLVDLLYWPDESIRKPAAERLAATLGKDRVAKFDPAKDPYDQATLIESLRASLPTKAKAR